ALAEVAGLGVGVGVAGENRRDGCANDDDGERDGEEHHPGDSAPDFTLALGRIGSGDVGFAQLADRVAADARHPRRRGAVQRDRLLARVPQPAHGRDRSAAVLLSGYRAAFPEGTLSLGTVPTDAFLSAGRLG